MNNPRILSITVLALLLVACASPQVKQCPVGTQNLPDCPPLNAVNDEKINKLYELRTWLPPRKQTIDPIKSGVDAQIPINQARAKVIGPTYDEALKSLAVKLWLIENAQHTVDVMYYIFAHDPVGYAILGALCNAVKRGVDVRLMVDSIGSMHPSHNELKAVETCATEAGFIRNAKGEITTKKARVQVMVFNAFSKFNFNRRSHDKLLVVDGHFPDTASVMTGGRNISLDYYGIKEDGSKDPTAFRDMEILLRVNEADKDSKLTVGSVSELYYTLLFLHKGNRRLVLMEDDEYDDFETLKTQYRDEREEGQKNLKFLKSLPEIQKHMENMPRYMSEDFRNTDVKLAHQLSNLTNTDVTTQAMEHIAQNPNSIMYLINKITEKRLEEGVTSGTLRIVSPYLFTYKYYNEEDELVYDEAQEILDLLNKYPDIKLEVITNSVMTSDNFFTQSIIDMDMAPRFLLTPELREVWRSKPEEGEYNPQVVESEEWKKLIDHPQIFIYQTGRLDSILLGKGSTYYGKLHAKFIVGPKVGFIGTSNFDYRSNLYNNELGFFYRSPELRQDLLKIFDLLKSTSYRWGTPEWLQMRKELIAADIKKSGPARKQRGTYKTIKTLGVEYLM